MHESRKPDAAPAPQAAVLDKNSLSQQHESRKALDVQGKLDFRSYNKFYRIQTENEFAQHIVFQMKTKP